MATDKRLDKVSTLTDFDYALIVKGDQVAKASKQQLAELVGNLLYGATNASSLATVVAGEIRDNKITTLPDYGIVSTIDDLNAIKGFGVAYVYAAVGLGSEGNVFCIPFSMKAAATQVFIGYQGSPRKIRTFNWSAQTWSAWESL